jgi:hypothetical protein
VATGFAACPFVFSRQPCPLTSPVVTASMDRWIVLAFATLLCSISAFAAVNASSKMNGFCSVGYPYPTASQSGRQSFVVCCKHCSHPLCFPRVASCRRALILPRQEMLTLKPNWIAIVEDWGQSDINSTDIQPAYFSQNNSNLLQVPLTVLLLVAYDMHRRFKWPRLQVSRLRSSQ